MDRSMAIGGLLMLVGIALFLPVLTPDVQGLQNLILVPAAASLVYGTYLVGTSGGDDEPVV